MTSDRIATEDYVDAAAMSGGGGPFVDLEVTHDLTVGNVLTVGNIATDGGLNVTGGGGVSISSGVSEVARIDMADGIALTALDTIRIGVDADETIMIYDGAGLAGADRPAIATQVGTVDVAAFNALRDALIALGVVIDGD